MNELKERLAILEAIENKTTIEEIQIAILKAQIKELEKHD